jgi:hypothetical protein
MTHPPTSFNRTRAARVTTAAATSIFIVSMIMARPAEARGGHRRHSDGAHMKAASQEEDKLLNSKIKSICRGC